VPRSARRLRIALAIREQGDTDIWIEDAVAADD
jgi:hypothetical protein